MSRPLFLADHDVNARILSGLQQKEPLIDLIRARDVGLAAAPDPDVLEYAAGVGRVVSHDENSMIGAAVERLRAGRPMTGLLIAPQRTPIGRGIDELVMVWAASEADEWVNMIQFLPM